METSKLSVDRLTIVGFKIDYKLENLLNDITFDLIEKRFRTSFPYEWQYNLIGGGVLQVGNEHNQSNIRLDFNPNSVKEGRHKDQIKKLIACMKYVKLTRIDVAIDLKEVDLDNYSFIDHLSLKNNTWRSGVGRLETHYIGAPTSDFRIRIYDKALEQGKKGNWWRIEAQMRREFAENYKYFNPFEKLTLVKKDTDLSHIKNFKEQIFIDHLLKNPEDLSKLAQSTMYKYKKILQDLGESSSTHVNFTKIYNSNLKFITQTVEDYLQESYVNNVIQV